MKKGKKLLAVCSTTAIVIFGGAGVKRYLHVRGVQQEIDAATNYKFPLVELTALDRDVQRRFAEIPTKMFGLDRIGPSHGLYQPHTWPEKQTVAALKAKGYEVAFYVMSQRTYHDEHGYYGFYPIQGPVHVTSPRQEPHPRWDGFFGGPKNIRPGTGEHLPHPDDKMNLRDPQGTPVPTTIAEGRVPDSMGLRDLGFKMIRVSEKVPANQFIGGGTQLSGGWHVVATAVRANDKRCVNCHIHQGRAREEHKPKLGDAFGIAMYVYRKRLGNS